MVILLYAFLLGCVCGLRSMTAPAVVAWGAHRGWLHLDGSLLAFFANKISLVSGYTYRHRLSSMVPDMLLALIEDLVAVAAFCWSPACENLVHPERGGHHSVLFLGGGRT